MTEQDRLQLRQKLLPTLGEHCTTVLMEALPPVDHSELATKSDLALMRRELRGDMGELRTDLRGEMAELRTGLRGEMAELRGEMGRLEGRIEYRLAVHLRTTVAVQIASLAAFVGIVLGLG